MRLRRRKNDLRDSAMMAYIGPGWRPVTYEQILAAADAIGLTDATELTEQLGRELRSKLWEMTQDDNYHHEGTTTMTTNTAKPALHEWEILHHIGAEHTRERVVRAAYFKHEDDFVSFKDSDNKVVYALAKSMVISIRRRGDGAEAALSADGIVKPAEVKRWADTGE